MARNQLGDLVADKGKTVIDEWRKRNPGRDIDLSSAQLTNCDLSGVDFRRADLRHANLSYCNLEDCIFDGANLSLANLSSARLTNASFHSTNLQGAKLRNTVVGRFNLIPDPLSGSFVVESVRAASFERANLGQVDFTAATLCGVSFLETSLEEADFTDAVLDAASFIDCDLIKTRFIRAQMVCTKICGGILRQTDLSLADLFWTVFRGIREVSANNDATAIFSRESRRDYVACLEARMVRSIEQSRGAPSFQVESPGEARAEATGTHGRGSTVVNLPQQPTSLTYNQGPSRRPAKD